MIKSRIILNSLTVTKDGMIAYQQKFHRGLNIIRGDNSVGKTTVLDLIYYVLGAEIKEDQWVYPANICSYVIAEVVFGNATFTLKRSIEPGKIPSTEIYSGTYDRAMNDVQGWLSFGPRRTESKASFSQQIFDILGWENSKSDDYANLTMHNILRMLYADQETSDNKFFKAEVPNADSENQRLAIAEFMLGLDNLETHNTRQELLKANREFEKTKSELDAIYLVIGTDSIHSLETLNQEIAKLHKEIQEKEELKKNGIIDGMENEETKFAAIEILNEIEEIAIKLTAAEEKKSVIELEINDCELFDQTIKYRKKALLESQATYAALGSVHFEICPSCHAKISPSGDANTCHLCKSDQENSHLRTEAYLTTLTELQFHEKNNITVKENLKSIIRIMILEIDSLSSNILSKRMRVRELSMQTNSANARDSELSREIGFIEAQIEAIKEKADTVSRLDSLRKKKNDLNARISQLEDDLAAAMAKNAAHRKSTLDFIGDRAKEILEKDTKNEESFIRATTLDVEIDFAKDRWLLDGRSKFSGSSMVIKKNALHLACLLYALSSKTARHPRFLMLDGIEEGGMTEIRSKNFQKLVYDLFLPHGEECQIIMTTAKIDESLNNDEICVGPFYEKGHYTISVY